MQNNTTAETISGYCTYEGGYFDIKYMTKEFLRDAAQKGSVTYFLEILSWQVPTDIGNVLSRYAMDFEQWWRIPRPNVNEW